MCRSLITVRLRSARCDLALDLLERRQVMSVAVGATTATGSLLDKLSVSPGDGQVFSVASAPTQIVLDLKAARLAGLPPAAFSWANGNIALEQVASDGTTRPVGDPSDPPSASLDDVDQTVTIPITAPLQPGKYRIVLVGGGRLAQTLAAGSSASDQDQTLAEFEVVGKTTTLRDAVDLGSIGSSVVTASGSLELQGGGVALYKITLGADQPLWRLGLQINAQAIGSPLRGALTLFDQQGRAIATRNAGMGLAPTVDDPYLFAALAPGVYYVGVSGAGNLGGQPGGYDPATGAAGQSTTVNDVGPFQLQVVADPLTTPMKVVGFALNHDDPASTAATGFTVTFSEAVDPQSLHLNPLFVQNQQGRNFPVFLSSMGSSPNQVEFLFDRLLPPGEYRLVLPQTGGPTDLVGRAPINPDLPAGTLAAWTIQSTEAFSDAGNQISAVLSPNGVGLGAAGTNATTDDGRITLRVVVPPSNPGLLYVTSPAQSLDIELSGAGGTVTISGDKLGSDFCDPVTGVHYDFQFSLPFTNGVYYIKLSPNNAENSSFAWKLTVTGKDSLLSSAVGSSGALGLRMIGASPGDLPTGSIASDSPVTAPGPGSGPMVLGKLPSNFTVTVGSTLVGRPSAENDAVAAVGAGAPGGLAATSGRGGGPAAGALTASGYGDDGGPRDAEGLVVTQKTTPAAARDRFEAPIPHRAPRPTVDAPSGADADADADVLALLDADRRAEAARSVAWWLLGGSDDDREAVPTRERLDLPARAEPIVAEADRNASAGDDASGKVERAALGAPVGIVVAAAAAFRFRQAARRWWRNSVGGSTSSGSFRPPLFKGPRYMVPPVGRSNRSRKRELV